MNTFTYLKCFNFGRMIPSEFKGTWEEMIATEDWKKLLEKHSFTEKQCFFIMKGMKGLPFEEPKAEGIMPFGEFKGRPFDKVPDQYLIWLSKQEWLEKWPIVATHVNQFMSSADIASPEDIKNLLKL